LHRIAESLFTVQRYCAGVEPSDSDIKVQLLLSPPERWQRLWSAVDDLLAEQPSPREIRIQNADGSLCLPYAVYSDAVDRVQHALYEVDAIVGFDWTNWDGIRRYQGDRDLADAPVADACRMLTLIMRAERFNDGTIGRALDDGTFQAALLRLRKWYDGIAEIHAEHIHTPPGQSWLSRRISRLRRFQALLRD
jgi:hypothetical protein